MRKLHKKMELWAGIHLATEKIWAVNGIVLFVQFFMIFICYGECVFPYGPNIIDRAPVFTWIFILNTIVFLLALNFHEISFEILKKLCREERLLKAKMRKNVHR